MTRLVLYSDQVDSDRKMDSELLKLAGGSPSIAYIPSCSDINRTYFRQRINYYNALGITKVDYFDLDQEFDPITVMDMFNYDAIHLSGGNTYYFLNTLKRRDFLEPLRSYVSNGGILIGVSAGSILMAETIDIALFADEDIVGSPDTSALSLVDFEFAPHWDGSSQSLEQVREYAQSRNKVVYVCSDGDGLVVNEGDIQLIGDVVRIGYNK